MHVDPRNIPAHLRLGYKGQAFQVNVTTSVTIPADAGLWSGGARTVYSCVDLETGRDAQFPGQSAAPWNDKRCERRVDILPGLCVVEHSVFCGRDMGLIFHVHPDNAAPLLPQPCGDLTAAEKGVLYGTRSFKSSYMGRDRYQMTQEDGRYSKRNQMSRAEWDAAKVSLVAKGLLNKAGALTVAGKNAAATLR